MIVGDDDEGRSPRIQAKPEGRNWQGINKPLFSFLGQ
jgi:hypothetical protein